MTILGIDISHYQGAPDFNAAKTAGIGFVFMKATEGTSYVDTRVSENQARARAAGLTVGFYHFARATNAIAEADHFCNVLGTLSPGDLVALDWEVKGSDPVGWSLAWLQHVEQRLGVKPLIYMNKSAERGSDWTPVVKNDNGLWLANYDFDANNPQPALVHWPFAAIEQYSDRGTVSGVAGGVDLDVFGGSEEQLAKYGFGGVAPTPPPPPTPTPAPEPATAFPYPHDECFGLITDPSNKVHGGINAQEKVYVKQIQVALQQLGYAPNVPGWADGVFEKQTADSVTAWQRARMPGTTIFGQVWFDDWAALIQGQYPAPPPSPGDGSSLPSLAYGQTNATIKHLQHFCNLYPWNPVLPLIQTTGYYGDVTARVLHLAGKQLGVQGDKDGKNFGPQFKAAFWRIGFRG